LIEEAEGVFRSDTLQRVREHAEEDLLHEVCGFIVAVNNREIVMPVENTHPQDREHHARIDGRDYAIAEDLGQILAIYHSHGPKHPADPSQGDIIASERLNIPYLVYSTRFERFTLYRPDGYRVPLVGRTWIRGVLDCRTLCRDYYHWELGIEIPDEYDWEAAETEEDAHKILSELDFVVVHPKTVRGHDLLHMRLPELDILHFCIFLPDGRILQHVQGRLSARVIYGSRYRDATRSVYRHRSLVKPTDAVHD
jgi:proteasome lid subunit RPN8/RPN11